MTSATSSRVIIRKLFFREGNPEVSGFNDGRYRSLTYEKHISEYHEPNSNEDRLISQNCIKNRFPTWLILIGIMGFVAIIIVVNRTNRRH